jgi:hypothetical protein
MIRGRLLWVKTPASKKYKQVDAIVPDIFILRSSLLSVQGICVPWMELGFRAGVVAFCSAYVGPVGEGSGIARSSVHKVCAEGITERYSVVTHKL